MLFWSVIAVLSAILLFGLLAQRVFIRFMRENEGHAIDLMGRYFQIDPPRFKDFKQAFLTKLLGIPNESIIAQIVDVVSRPINSWTPPSASYMDMVEFHIKNLGSYRFQDCIIRILLICGILGTLICFALQASKLVDDGLVQTAANGFSISAFGIGFAVVLIFVRYFWVESAVNSFSRKCEELVVTGLIPAFHVPSNSVLQQAVNNFSQHIGDMQESFSSLKVAMENISSTQNSNNESLSKHMQGLGNITKDFQELSKAIRSVTLEEGPFVSLLRRINASENEFTKAIMELLPKHNAEFGEMKQAVEEAASAQKKMADSVASSVNEAYGNQAKLLLGAIAQMNQGVEAHGKSCEEVLSEAVSRMGQACTTVSRTVKNDHALMQNAVKEALSDMSKTLKENAETQLARQTVAMADISKSLKENAETQLNHQTAAMDGMSNVLKEHAKTQQARQEEAFSRFDETANKCKELVLEASKALIDSSQKFADRIASALAGEMQELKTAVGGIVDAMKNVDEDQRKHLAGLISEKVSQIETRLKDVATAESCGHIQECLQKVATLESLGGIQSSIDQLATKQDEVNQLVGGHGEALSKLRESSGKLSVFANSADKIVSVGKKIDEIQTELKEIAANAQKAANKRGFNW